MRINNFSRLRLWMLIILLLACFTNTNAARSDIDCLRSIKESLQDPENLLSSWDFNNQTEGFLCGFVGVYCWHAYESSILNIVLSDMGLRGPFPMGIKNCTSITRLDLSNNRLSGPIPSNLGDVLPYITTLDLSNNTFSGQIPLTLSNCSFLNVLRLDNNHLTGQIPPELGGLYRIKEFNVANNRLSGSVPVFSSSTNISLESYANNLGLCGGPLNACKHEHRDHEHHDSGVVFGFAGGFGFSLSTIVTILVNLCCLPTLSMRPFFLMVEKIKEKMHHLIPKSPQILFAEEISNEESKVTAMEKYICRLNLAELVAATNDFDYKRAIGYGNMGIMYKGMFLNGLLLAVKRLHKFETFEQEFLLEIEILGRLRHTNLVPLLGFCFEMEKKFLVYKYMSNGTLHQWIHTKPQVEGKKMGWNLRFKIAIGIARGLAWLHYNNVLRVAHLRISSECILLDDEFEPKISNFGNSNILMNTSGIPLSSCSFVVPDSGISPYKEDIYRFGILLIELVSGKEKSMQINFFINHVCVDECLMGQGFDDEIYETLRIAENCIQAREDRKSNMLQVYQAMRAISMSRNKTSVGLCIDVEDKG